MTQYCWPASKTGCLAEDTETKFGEVEDTAKDSVSRIVNGPDRSVIK